MDNQSNKKSLSADIVFEALKSKIEKNVWHPGDRLPSENDLAEEYGVSRVTIRTALHKLSALGLVDTQTGGGTYVAKFNFYNLIDSVSNIMFANVSHDEISQYRIMIETATIDLISTKPILSKYLRELQSCINRMEKSANVKSSKTFAHADYDFHLCLCKMTENNMFIYSYEMLISIMLNYFEDHYIIGREYISSLSSAESDAFYRNAVRDHQRILEALQTGEFTKAKELIVRMANEQPPLIEE